MKQFYFSIKIKKLRFHEAFLIFKEANYLLQAAVPPLAESTFIR